MSTRRAPNIPEIPPFRGAGPLQSRNAPNRPTTASGGNSDAKAMMAPPSAAGSQNRRVEVRQGGSVSSTSGGRSERERQAAKLQQQARAQAAAAAAAPSEPRPSSRLASEKKRDYKDPPSIGPWQLGKLIGQGASGEFRLLLFRAS